MNDIQKQIRVHQLFTKEMGENISDRLPLSWVTIFLQVAEAGDAGVLQKDLVAKTGHVQSQICRIAKMLSCPPFEERGTKYGGVMLLNQVPDWSEKGHPMRITLSDRGKSLVREVQAILSA